jgi:A/G-specific adenine glycosylase
MNFSKTLINWYSIHKRSLPWRNTTNPYYIWLSEIILQQTQVKQGWPYYEAFVTKYPSVFDLAEAKEQDVLNLWQGLGYYSRARNLHVSAKYIANELDGVFPSTYKTIKELKGVGDYTASAIASISFNEVTAVVDGNVYRVLSRVFGIETPINSAKGIKEFKLLAQELIDIKQPAAFNQAIMDYGSQVCKPKQPMCTDCVFTTNCKAIQLDKVNELPLKLKKIKVTSKFFNFIVYLNGANKVVLEQRTTKGIWQNMYQFPLLETKEQTSYSRIVDHVSTILSEENPEIYIYNETPLVHKLSHQHLNTTFWIVKSNFKGLSWIPIQDLKDYPVPVLINNFINEFNF